MSTLNRQPRRVAVQGLLLLILFMLIPPLLAQGATYYVTKTGNDENTCVTAQSQGTAKLTITAGLACLSGGDSLIIGDGTYAESIIGTIPNGTAGAPTVVRAANRNMAILAPTSSPEQYVIRFSENSYITVDGIVADAANLAEGAAFGFFPHPSTNIVLQNGTARNGQGIYGSGIDGIPVNSQILNMDILNNGSRENLAHGIYISGSGNVIDGNRIRNSGAYAIVLYSSSSSRVSNNVIRNNKIYDNTHRGVGLFGTGNLMYNNIIYNNGRGIDVGAGDNRIYNNTLYNNGNH